MCQRIGRPPISTIGLGRNSVSSRRRVPIRRPEAPPSSRMVAWQCDRVLAQRNLEQSSDRGLQPHHILLEAPPTNYFATLFGHLPAADRVGGEKLQPVRQLVDITGSKRVSILAVLYQVRAATNLIADQDGAASAHRFIYNQAPRLTYRWKNENVTKVVIGGQLCLIDDAGKSYGLPSVCPRAPFELGALLAIAHKDQTHLARPGRRAKALHMRPGDHGHAFALSSWQHSE